MRQEGHRSFLAPFKELLWEPHPALKSLQPDTDPELERKERLRFEGSNFRNPVSEKWRDQVLHWQLAVYTRFPFSLLVRSGRSWGQLSLCTPTVGKGAVGKSPALLYLASPDAQTLGWGYFCLRYPGVAS